MTSNGIGLSPAGQSGASSAGQTSNAWQQMMLASGLAGMGQGLVFNTRNNGSNGGGLAPSASFTSNSMQFKLQAMAGSSSLRSGAPSEAGVVSPSSTQQQHQQQQVAVGLPPLLQQTMHQQSMPWLGQLSGFQSLGAGNSAVAGAGNTGNSGHVAPSSNQDQHQQPGVLLGNNVPQGLGVNFAQAGQNSNLIPTIQYLSAMSQGALVNPQHSPQLLGQRGQQQTMMLQMPAQNQQQQQVQILQQGGAAGTQMLCAVPAGNGTMVILPQGLPPALAGQYLASLGLTSAARSCAEPPIGNASSKYRGVSWHKRDRKWLARTWIDGKIEHLGCYRSEQMAALAVDLRTIEHFGNRAKKELNFPDPFQRQQLIAVFQQTGEFRVKTAADLAVSYRRGPNKKTKSRIAAAKRASEGSCDDSSSFDDGRPSGPKRSRTVDESLSSVSSDSTVSDLSGKQSHSGMTKAARPVSPDQVTNGAKPMPVAGSPGLA